MREARPFGQRPKYLIRDNDSKYGVDFARVAAGSGITVLNTPVAAPNANAVCERFQKSVRQECSDHLFLLGQRHMSRVIRAYGDYFNRECPHQGIGQRIPMPLDADSPGRGNPPPVRVIPILGRLHHAYRCAA